VKKHDRFLKIYSAFKKCFYDLYNHSQSGGIAGEPACAFSGLLSNSIIVAADKAM
jgi:hypothetical protein